MSHPNIVGFKHVFEDDDFVYMILELCENKVIGAYAIYVSLCKLIHVSVPL